MMETLELSSEQEARATALHKKAIVVDASLTGSFAHPALEVDGQSYLDRSLTAGLTVAEMTLGEATAPTFRDALADINLHHRLIRQKPDKLLLVTHSDDFQRAKKEGKIGLILGFQNATQLEDDWLNTLPVLHALGVRVIQLTYNETNLLGSGCLEPVDIGLTAYGRQVVRAMNSMGIAMDLSHVGDKTSMQAIEVSKDPVFMTHANPKALNDSPRNKPDDIIKAVADSGGVFCCVSWNVLCATKKGVQPTVFDIVDHMEYVADLVGIDHVGFGSDMNENFTALPVTSAFEEVYAWMMDPYRDLTAPVGMASVDDYPNLTRALVARGYSDSDILKIMGGNVLRVASELWDRNS